MAADQLEMFSIANPCIGVCESNQRGYCKGCLRSRDERFNWHAKAPAEQSEILQRLSKRRARLLQQRKKSQHENDSPNLQLPGFTDE
ncbi:hypothetical protein CWE09_01200 [Aliidiomarina minuta]|uniref:DUF1289 domain-containing protein n=1 Tax=Aliidiomarina minuta TaxID=880057 RepID=A0A432W5S3_9GAMM|nr:DUF1289 domain-containing protein [Aliidiomarina minuta]RUO25381.1 hypothetical protein CWE09_01200 [Aliidiomarina minuta]